MRQTKLNIDSYLNPLGVRASFLTSLFVGLIAGLLANLLVADIKKEKNV